MLRLPLSFSSLTLLRLLLLLLLLLLLPLPLLLLLLLSLLPCLARLPLLLLALRPPPSLQPLPRRASAPCCLLCRHTSFLRLLSTGRVLGPTYPCSATHLAPIPESERSA